MVRKNRNIEVYLRIEKIYLPADISSLPSYDRRHIQCLRVESRKIEDTHIPEEDQKILNFVKEIAKEANFSVKIVNVNSFIGKLKAKFKGIRKFPAVVIGQHKIEGNITKDEIKSLIDKLA